MAGPQLREMRRHPAGRGNGDEEGLRMMNGRRRLDRLPQQLLDSGRVFMMLGALLMMWCDIAGRNAEHDELFAFFVLWLLGTALAMLAIVARQFPRLASAADKRL